MHFETALIPNTEAQHFGSWNTKKKKTNRKPQSLMLCVVTTAYIIN